jgi:hypothetical protein
MTTQCREGKKKKQDNVKHAKFQLKRIIKEIIGIKVANTRQTNIKASKRTLDARKPQEVSTKHKQA